MDNIIAHYRIESCLPLAQVAETIAGEQSSGTFLSIPGETEELKARSRAKVRSLKILDEVAQPSLPGGRLPKNGKGLVKYQRAEIALEFPIANLGPNLPTLLATVCGNLYELSDHTGCKLLDIELPAVFGERYPGPQFSVAGTRKLAGVYDRPIIGTIVKPFDTLRNEHLAIIGKAIHQLANGRQLFVVGSSGVEYALVAHWKNIQGHVTSNWTVQRSLCTSVKHFLAVSGSCSPVTDRQIGSKSIYGLPPAFVLIGKQVWSAGLVAVLVTLLGHLLLSRTLLGRRLYAIGHNAKAALISGVPVNRTVVMAYAFSGLTAGVAAVLISGKMETGSPVHWQRNLLDVIGATVIGGTSLFGGKGKILWTVCGVLFLTLIDNSLNLMNLSFSTIMMIKGGVILLAALLDAMRNRVTGGAK